MRYQDKNSKELLDAAIREMRSEQPTDDELRAASHRAWKVLSDRVGAESAAVSSIRGCSDVRALLPQYREGELSKARELVIEAHLHECVACRR